MTTAFYPGSFDPIHRGHLTVIAVAAAVFDRVIVGVGYNAEKPSGMFTPDVRAEMIRESVATLDPIIARELGEIDAVTFTGLATVAAESHGADTLVKGVRGAVDLSDEMQQADMNLRSGAMPTLLVPATGPDALVSSRYVRDITRLGGDVSRVVPEPVLRRLLEITS